MKFRLRRPSPLVQLTMALVTMTLSMLMLADVLLNFSGPSSSQERQVRKQVSEALAVQTAALLRSGDTQTLEQSLGDTLLRVNQLRSIGLRRADGELLLSAGPHHQAWQREGSQESTADQVRVALSANGVPWGALELAYQAEHRSWWVALAAHPLAQLLLFVAVVGGIGYALYLRRALQHLDPTSVIPDRVQRAFDAMAEGVVVLDARGQVMLANRAFRDLCSADQPPKIGQSLAAVDWLARALPADPAGHPWARAMQLRKNSFDDPLVVPVPATATGEVEQQARGQAAPEPRRLVVNCAPILDNGGAVRGCMVTFNDLSELHRAHAALQRTMEELDANREELKRNNLQLHRLATRDAMTGCLNRRAFMEGAQNLLAGAHGLGPACPPVGCLMLDIDHFKSINDTHGHGIGDRVITEAARVMLDTASSGALVGRYGGEEFCVIVAGADIDGMCSLAEQIRRRVEGEVGPRVTEVSGLRVTISVGAALLAGNEDTLAALLDRADQGLYRAKRGGRNRVAQFASVQSEELAAQV